MNTYFSMDALKSVTEHLPEKLIASAGVTTRFTTRFTQGLRKDFVRKSYGLRTNKQKVKIYMDLN